MNSAIDTKVLALISSEGDKIYNLPLHFFEELLGLNPGFLISLERACDPERGSAYDAEDYASYKDKKSVKLWCLTETYLYDYKAPSDAVVFLKRKFVDHHNRLSIDPFKALVVVEFFTLLHNDPVTSYSRFNFSLDVNKPMLSCLPNSSSSSSSSSITSKLNSMNDLISSIISDKDAQIAELKSRLKRYEAIDQSTANN